MADETGAVGESTTEPVAAEAPAKVSIPTLPPPESPEVRTKNREAEARRVAEQRLKPTGRGPQVEPDIQAAIEAAVQNVKNETAIEIAILKGINELGLTVDDARFAQSAKSPEEAYELLTALKGRYQSLAGSIYQHAQTELAKGTTAEAVAAATPNGQAGPPKVAPPQLMKTEATPKTWAEWKEAAERGIWNQA